MAKIIDKLNESTLDVLMKVMAFLGVYLTFQTIMNTEFPMFFIIIIICVISMAWIWTEPEQKTKSIPVVIVPTGSADPVKDLSLRGAANES